jgi:multidrug efflux system outer membrane protein
MRSVPRAASAFAVAAIAVGGLALAPLVRAQPTPVIVPGVAPLPGSSSSVYTGTGPIVGAVSSAPKVDESPPPPLAEPAHVVGGWKQLWTEASKNTVDLRIALAEIERAEAATRIAWGAALPQVNASATLTHIPAGGSGSASFFPASSNTLSMQISAVQPLINLRAWHAIGTARELEDLAHLSIADVRRRVGVGLARAAVGIASAQRLAELNRVSLQAALERLALTRKRLAAGVGDTRDLVRAQQDVAQSRSVIAGADEALVQAREGLAVLLSLSGELGVAADPGALEAEILAFCGDVKGKPEERPDVIIAKKQIDIAKRNVDDIALKFVPTLTAQLSANATGLAFSGPFVTGWTISGTLSIPLYDGGVRYGEKRDREALVEEARARAVQTEVSAMVEVSQARRAIAVAEAAQVAAREARDLAAEADRLARVAYAAGVGTNFDLIDAGRTLRTAETQLILRDLDVARARLSLPFLEGNCAGVTAAK